MTRSQLLHLLIGQARKHGFEFRKWFTASIGIPWTGADHAVEWLARGHRTSLLLFSHAFARAFFRSGERISFIVPPQSFQRVKPGGGSTTVERRAHLRHSSRADVWRFHLQEMAIAPEPLRYIRRFLLIEETLEEVEAVKRQARDPTEENYDEENLVREY